MCLHEKEMNHAIEINGSVSNIEGMFGCCLSQRWKFIIELKVIIKLFRINGETIKTMKL